ANGENLKTGIAVYVLPLSKEGQVVSYSGGEDAAEVQVGMLKLRVALQDLRVLPEGRKPASIGKPAQKLPPAQAGGEIPFIMQTSTNTLDLRGLQVDEAVKKMWKFIDAAVLRGEPNLVIIHGHGGGDLKRAVRFELAENSPYGLKFRAGGRSEGGDGTTIV